MAIQRGKLIRFGIEPAFLLIWPNYQEMTLSQFLREDRQFNPIIRVASGVKIIDPNRIARKGKSFNLSEVLTLL